MILNLAGIDGVVRLVDHVNNVVVDDDHVYARDLVANYLERHRLHGRQPSEEVAKFSLC